MFAELFRPAKQLSFTRPSLNLLSRSETLTYKTTKLESASNRHRFPHLPAANQTKHSDLYKEFYRWLELVKELGEGQARQQLRQMLHLNLLALRDEIKGYPYSSTVIKITKKNGQVFYQRSEFPGGDDLERSYQTIHPSVSNSAERDRYSLENQQLRGVFNYFKPLLAELPLDWEPSAMASYLTSPKGQTEFTTINLPVTESLSVLFPTLTDQEQVQAWSTSRLQTISPPSQVHNKGKTSFSWLDRILYIPELHEAVLYREGFFTGFDTDEIARLIDSEGDQKTNRLSEAYLFALQKVLPPEFIQLHAITIFQQLAQERIGYIRPVPPVPGAVVESNIELEDLTQTLVAIFEWELEHCSQDPETAAQAPERLTDITNKILHHLATDTPINVLETIKYYQKFYSQHQHAANPKAFRVQADKKYVKINPSFARISVDLSLLECGAGGIVRAMSGSGYQLNFSELTQMFGLKPVALVEQYQHRNLTDRKEFIEVCRQLGKNPDNFNTLGVCQNPNCEYKHWLGRCNWCVFCEIKDDWGVDHVPSANEQIITSTQNNDSKTKVFKSQASLSDLLAGDIWLSSAVTNSLA